MIPAILFPTKRSANLFHEKIRELVSTRSPVVWIGGSEPLHHPGAAHLVRTITGSGHFVFLETDGTLLRRRIHEFQPVSRLFLTVRLEPGARGPISKRFRAGAFELASEGIRAAVLSGFLICVHALVHAETDLTEMAEFIQFAHSLDVDGIVITPANSGTNGAAPDAAALQRKTAQARKPIGSMWWGSFSRILEPLLSGGRHAVLEPLLSGGRHAVRSASDTGASIGQEARANEEGVRVA